MHLLQQEPQVWVAILITNSILVKELTSNIRGSFCMIPFFIRSYEIQPALRIIARDKNIIKKVQVILFRDASALLALLNIELPLAAIPPIPSPLGL